MRWSLLLVLCLTGCVDEQPAAPGAGLGPGTDIGVIKPPVTDAGVDGSVDGSVDGGADAGEPLGACDNESDLEALDDAIDDARDVARVCGWPNNASLLLCLSLRPYDQCITQCVVDEIPDLSIECAACYGALEGCSLQSFCQARCQFDGCSAQCLDCLNGAGCLEDYEECRGLPGDGCS